VIHRSLVLSIAVILLLNLASEARAGTFEVVACDAASGFVNNSWQPQVTHGGTGAFAACPSGDDAMKGLLARSVYPLPSGWTVPRGAAARWLFFAPPATAIVGLRANAYFAQRHHRWQVGLSNGSQLLVGCPATGNTGGVCGAHLTADRTLPIPGSAVIYTEVFCASGPCPVGGGSWYGWASMTWIAVIVQDDVPPSIGNVGGELWTDRWIGGTRRVSFDASDGSGIKDVRAVIDGCEMARSGRTCDPTVKGLPGLAGRRLGRGHDELDRRRQARPGRRGRGPGQ
jgi:hypothetical protein